ncbi:4Fe-4S dicluster domain-containing protein [candidate division KSB1 bacterium]
MKRIYAKEEYCLGCRLCEIHCLVSHSRSKKIIKAFKDEHETAVPAIQVEESGIVSFALQCRHCDDAPCLEACITGAMHRDPETGTILCDTEACVGCWMCVMVCPLGAVNRGREHRVASKCDLCLDEGSPVCVENCPNEAIVYEER